MNTKQVAIKGSRTPATPLWAVNPLDGSPCSFRAGNGPVCVVQMCGSAKVAANIALRVHERSCTERGV